MQPPTWMALRKAAKGREPVESRLTDDDVRAFLIRVYFKNAQHPVSASIDRAYLDFRRTLRGLQEYVNRSNVKSATEKAVYDAIIELTSSPIASQEEFDIWHKDTCDELRSKFGDFHFHYGQAQKWINMSLKYLFILDKPRIAPYWQYCHVPIDRDILRAVKRYNPPTFSCAWSKIDDYEKYLYFQVWLRNKLSGIPMDNEWRLWLGSPARLRADF
jgi:hypothetical protein